MEILDRPLSEIIKEQKIGESLRKNRRSGPRGGRGAPRNNNNNNSGGRWRSGGGRGRGLQRSRNNNNNNNRNGRGGNRPRLTFRARGVSAGRFRRRFALDLGDDRRDRSVKSFAAPRRAPAALERNDRIRQSRRREALNRARFSRD